MCFAGFSLRGDVCFLSSLVSLLLQTEASDGGISPPPLGKDAAGGRGRWGYGVVDFSWFLQPIGKCLGERERRSSEAQGMELNIFRFSLHSPVLLFFLSSVKSEDKGESRGCETLRGASIPPSLVSVSALLYAPLVSSTSTNSLIVLAAGLWSRKSKVPSPLGEKVLISFALSVHNV